MTTPQSAIALTNTPVMGQPFPPIRTAAIAEQKYIMASLVLAFTRDPLVRCPFIY
ncbi:hypothetical protein [Altericista sp. CCNU0014]|uniref:hypothetical protein n=1 Tax=Altericista sp. CCNU0014 TaxID=3082949 RepID=UPI00385053B3